MKASLCLLEILNMVNKTADSINCGYTRTYLTPIIQKSKGKKPKMPCTFIITLHKVSDFNHITFREFYTLYLGFQQKSDGVPRKLKCHNQSEKLFLEHPGRNIFPSRVKTVKWKLPYVSNKTTWRVGLALLLPRPGTVLDLSSLLRQLMTPKSRRPNTTFIIDSSPTSGQPGLLIFPPQIQSCKVVAFPSTSIFSFIESF